MTYGEPQGYRGLRELICHKYGVFEKMKGDPENINRGQRLRPGLALAFGAFIDPGDAVIAEAPTSRALAQHDPASRPGDLDVPVDDAGHRDRRRCASGCRALRRQGRPQADLTS